MKHTPTKSKSPLLKSRAVRSIEENMRSQFATNVRENCSAPIPRVSSLDMLTKLLRMGIIGLMLCAANAWAGPASIQGTVKDAKGQPIKGADVRVESRDGKQLLKTVRTDATGRYVSQGLQPGVYRVSLVVNGAVKASITNTNTKAGQATQLNFDLKPVSTSAATKNASVATKNGKHMVWVPADTGSHIGGRWVEVNDGGTAGGALNVQKGSAEALHREQMQNAGGPQNVPGGSTGGGR